LLGELVLVFQVLSYLLQLNAEFRSLIYSQSFTHYVIIQAQLQKNPKQDCNSI